MRHDFVQPDECSAAYEEDVGRVDVAAVGQLDRSPFHDLEKSMLHAFARDAARLTIGRLELVDFVDEYDPVLRPGNVSARLVDQPLQNRFDLFVDVSGLREGGRLRRHERHAEHA
jgi:hypothetical protein